MTESDAWIFFGTIGIVIIIPIIVLTILYLIGLWKVLEKGGKPGWGSIIPFYGTYLLCEMTGINPWWIAIVLIAPLVPAFGTLISSVASLYFSILISISLARAFKKDDIFGLGLFFLPPVFYFMLGTSKSDEYVGACPMEDFLFDNLLKDNKTFNKKSTDNASKFCTNCGNKISHDASFCTNCGKKVK